MSVIQALINASKTVDSHLELKSFLDEFLSIEVENNNKTLIFSVDQTEIKINRNKLELRIGDFGNYCKVLLDSSGHIALSDAFGNSITLDQLQRRLDELPRQFDNYEDETGNFPDPPTGSGGGTPGGTITISDVQGLTAALSGKQASNNRLSSLAGLTNPASPQVAFVMPDGTIAMGSPLDPNSFQPRSDRLSQINGLQAATNTQSLVLLSNGTIALGTPIDTSGLQPRNDRLISLANLTNPTSEQLLFLLPNGSIGVGTPLNPASFQPANNRLTSLASLLSPTTTQGLTVLPNGTIGTTPIVDSSGFQTANQKLSDISSQSAPLSPKFFQLGTDNRVTFVDLHPRLSGLSSIAVPTTPQLLFLLANGSIGIGNPLDPASFQPANNRLTQLAGLTAQTGRAISYNASGNLVNVDILSALDAQTLARNSISSGNTSMGYDANTGIFTNSARLQQLHSLVAVTDRAIGFNASGDLVTITPSGGAFVQRLFVNNTGVNNTGNTNENVIYQFTIPANTLNANSCLDIELLLTMPSNANNKIIKIRFGAINIFNTTFTTNTQTLNLQRTLRNRNAMNSQVTYTNGVNSFGAATTAPIFPAIDFTQPQIFQVTGQCGVATDTIQFLGVSIKMY